MNLIRITFLFTVISLFSCGGDDPLSDIVPNSTWQLQSLLQRDCDDPSENVSLKLVENSCIEWFNDNWCNYNIVFNNDNSGYEMYDVDGDFVKDEFTYELNEDIGQITYCFSGNSECRSGKVTDNIWTIISTDSDGCVVEITMEKA